MIDKELGSMKGKHQKINKVKQKLFFFKFLSGLSDNSLFWITVAAMYLIMFMYE